MNIENKPCHTKKEPRSEKERGELYEAALGAQEVYKAIEARKNEERSAYIDPIDKTCPLCGGELAVAQTSTSTPKIVCLKHELHQEPTPNDWEERYRHEFQWGNEREDFHVFSRDDWKKVMQMHESFIAQERKEAHLEGVRETWEAANTVIKAREMEARKKAKKEVVEFIRDRAIDYFDRDGDVIQPEWDKFLESALTEEGV